MKGMKIHRKRHKWGLPVRLLLVVAVPVALFFWMDANLRPVILSMAEAQARVMAVQAMNDAVFDVMRSGELYDDLMTVVLDESGHVSVMRANTVRMNELATTSALRVQHNLSEIAEAGISIPQHAI